MKCVIALTLAALVAAQVPASVWDGVYTADQAKQGEAVYGKECASCHGAMLEGKGTAPPLAGSEFTDNWNGMTVGDLFEMIQTSMPADDPGRLSREQNAMVLAYIFKANTFPAGDTKLSDDAKRLGQIRFEAAKRKQ
jgi:mono/diheme cytochrome c family protein